MPLVVPQAGHGTEVIVLNTHTDTHLWLIALTISHKIATQYTKNSVCNSRLIMYQ
jgi:hypothetical protein